MRPWWEPEPEPVLLEQQRLSFSSECSRLLLPLSLLAPFTGNSTASGNFPVGYYCATCGRVNVQRFLRHRVCESATCNAGADVRRSEIGWVLSAFSTRDRKINSATISPDDKWSTPTTAEPAIGFDDGTRLFHYRLASSSTATSSTGDSGVPAPTASSSDDRSSSSIVVADAVAGSSSRSVRHIFNGNRAPLQARASALFETLQRDVRIERGIGATVFCTPVLESGDHHHHEMALEHRRDGDGDGRSTTWWGQQAGVIEGALRAYCCDLGPLRVHSLRIHAWVSDGKHRQTFCPRVKYLVLLCLGADISLLSIVPDSDSNAVKSGSKWKKESLRVTMVHGDSVVLSGGEFELLMVRAGMCMLLEAECV
ncbi:hypothetical protein BJV74DRAFT_448737 [Russula compacta]|nr:hypothetical protein BJV74DRAFT_448737 [Russula compacta]